MFAYFVDPSAAVEAASAAQHALRRHAWPEPVGELRVRMGVHAGLVHRAATGYSGLEVHLAARVMAAGHGGQVVVSAAARALLGSRFELVDLGEHRLKDFPTPERLWLLVHDERGPGDFPPLRTEPVRPTNLPPTRGGSSAARPSSTSLWDMLTGDGAAGHDPRPRRHGQDAAGRRRRGRAPVGLRGRRLARGPRGRPGSRRAAPGDRGGAGRRRRRTAAPSTRPSRGGCVRARRCSCSTTSSSSSKARPPSRSCSSRRRATRALVTSQLPLRVARERLLRLAPLSADSAAALFRRARPRGRARLRPAASTARRSRRSAPASTACRSRSSWPPRACRRSRRTSCSPAWTARSACSRAARATSPQRHRSLRAALDWTHALLEPDERTLLARLAAFAGPAPLDAVEAVAEVGGQRGPGRRARGLSGLIDASFVRRVDSREHGVRYTVAAGGPRLRRRAARRLGRRARRPRGARDARRGGRRDVPRHRHARRRRRAGLRARGRVPRRARVDARARPRRCTPESPRRSA